MQHIMNYYFDRFYEKEAVRSSKLISNNFAKAKEIAALKEDAAAKWNNIEILNVDIPEGLQINPHVGEQYKIKVAIQRNTFPDSVGVEFVVNTMKDGKTDSFTVEDISAVKTDDTITYFELDYTLMNAGIYKYSFRMYPKNPDLPHRQDFAYVRWF